MGKTEEFSQKKMGSWHIVVSELSILLKMKINRTAKNIIPSHGYAKYIKNIIKTDGGILYTAHGAQITPYLVFIFVFFSCFYAYFRLD